MRAATLEDDPAKVNAPTVRGLVKTSEMTRGNSREAPLSTLRPPRCREKGEHAVFGVYCMKPSTHLYDHAVHSVFGVCCMRPFTRLYNYAVHTVFGVKCMRASTCLYDHAVHSVFGV